MKPITKASFKKYSKKKEDTHKQSLEQAKAAKNGVYDPFPEFEPECFVIDAKIYKPHTVATTAGGKKIPVFIDTDL